MIWLRLAGILLISWVPLAIGYIKSKSMQSDLTGRKELLCALRELEQLLRVSMRPTGELLINMSRSGRFFFLDPSDPPDQVIENVCARLSDRIKDEQTLETTRSMFQSLRMIDAEGACACVSRTCDQLMRSVVEREETYLNKSPLYRKLGLLISVFLFILLL